MELRRVKRQSPEWAARGGDGVALFFEESCPGVKAADIIADAENAISFTHAALASSFRDERGSSIWREEDAILLLILRCPTSPRSDL